MHTKARTATIFVLLAVLATSGCGLGQLFGPPPLNDEEFAEAAREVCSDLKAKFEPLEEFVLFDVKAEACRQAADALADLEITEQSAPHGTQLRSSLAELADLYDAADKALSEAATKAGLKEPFTVMITEDGTVLAYKDSIFDVMVLEVDRNLIADLLSAQEQVREAAMSLNLKDCAIGN